MAHTYVFLQLSFFVTLLLLVAGYDEESDKALIDARLLKKYDGYGEDWIFMPDGKGQPQVAVLKGFIPESRSGYEEDYITFTLYTRGGPENGTIVRLNDTEALKAGGFSPKNPTKMITHGWKSSTSADHFQRMKNAYLEYDELNVILINWEPLAASTFYLGPVSNTIKVGTETAHFIDFMERDAGLRTQDVHLIGHSLGAHVVGNAGSRVTHGPVDRVTGLDPAWPGVHIFLNEATRLDSTDAKFVDVIHTCGGVLGWMQPLGHADFYPNGGTAVQPGCCCIPEVLDACSHGRSTAYFVESILSKVGFHAKQCSNWDYFVNGNCTEGVTVLMGERVDRASRGSHYLRTRDTSPHAHLEEVTSNDV